jgi:hypothetical protein
VTLLDALVSPMAVLLGAGASVEAGVPASVAMTESIVEALSQRPGGAGHALRYAVGAMIAHDSARGADPFGGIDVERLFAAIQMLAERDALEVAPFVAGWDQAMDSLGRRSEQMSPFLQRDIESALKANSGRQMARILEQAIRSQVPKVDDKVFVRVQTEMIQALRRLVTVEHENVAYLAPLLNLPRPLTIATLNYDRSVELMCASKGVEVDTGIGAWTGGGDWDWLNDRNVRLLKLHGSIDWVQGVRAAEPGRLAEPTVAVAENGSQDRIRPMVVFGQRGKLRADGPFLAMLREFELVLAQVETLLVVGYSFRDEHINVAIRRWLNADATHVIVVVDPFYPEDGQRLERSDFRSAMGSALNSTDDKRLHALRLAASQGLEELLGEAGQLPVTKE